MHAHHAITAQLAELHRRDLIADADRHRRISRSATQHRRLLRRR